MRAPFIAAALAASLLVAPAAPHRPRVYPNSSLTIFGMAEGPDGFLWLAASDGLYRFDGFHYRKVPGYPFGSSRFVAWTRDGSLWCGGLEGLARLHNQRFETVLREEVPSVGAYPDQLFVRLPKSLARLGLDGSLRPLPYAPRRDLLVDTEGRLWAVCIRPDRACWIDPKRPDQVQSMDLPSLGYLQAIRDVKGRIWVSDPEQVFLMENGRPTLKFQRQRSREATRAAPLLAGRNGQLWFLGETIEGIVTPVEFRDHAEYERFAPLTGLEDADGRLWVALLGRGLVEWVKDPKWERWSPDEFGNEAAAQVVRNRHGRLFLATEKHIYAQNTRGDGWSRLTAEQHRYFSLFALEEGGFLACTRDPGLVRLSPEGKIVERLNDYSSLADQHREIVPDGKGRLWVGAKRDLFRIEGRPGAFHLRREQLPDIHAADDANAVDLEVDASGRLWIGYVAGIAWLDDQDRWHKIATDRPVTTLRSFTLAGDDIWVSYRISGAFSRLTKKGDTWKVTSFTPAAGYGPMDTQFIKRDSRGWIWRGTPEGVFVCDGRHVAPGDWLHLHLGNGLASNETGQFEFFEDRDGSVWIAGDEGVSHLRPDASWFDAPHGAPPPKITRVEADGRVFFYPEPPPASLAAATRILRIDVGGLQAPPFRDYPLRYRLLPLSRDWQLSRDGTLEFRNLPEKLYTLEVGYTGNGASAIGSYPFRVGPAGSVLSWLWLPGILIGAGALVPVVRRVPRFDRLVFRAEHALFLLRRRYSHRQSHSPSASPYTADDYTGETLAGRYHLLKIVSRGGFSIVYEARDRRDGGARLAVKVLYRNAGKEGWVRDRFAHEVAALRSVEHAGVVKILDSWISPAGEPCLAMPFLDGMTLRAALQEGPLSVARARRIITQVGAALAEVHSHGIIHRDLKPENMILLAPETDREQAVIIDFGTAGLRTADNELAATTLMAGSFHYMAPERLTGRYSPASDVFSLAVIILEMLTGKRLADLNSMSSEQGFAGELEKVLRAAVKQAAKTVAELLTPAYDLDPRRRPAAVAEWTDELAEALGQ